MASTYTVFFLLSISFTCGGAQPQQKQCSHPIIPWLSPRQCRHGLHLLLSLHLDSIRKAMILWLESGWWI